MFKIGKTDTSFESPNFFHINQVPLVHHKKTASNKLLKPELKFHCSIENPLSLGTSSPIESKPKQKFRYEDITFINNSQKDLSLSKYSPESIKIPNSPKTRNSESPYSAYFNQVLETKGFNKEKSIFSKEFENPKLLRNYSEKLSILRSQINSFRKNEKMSEIHHNIQNKDLKYNKNINDILVKSTQRSALVNKEISEFEKRLQSLSRKKFEL